MKVAQVARTIAEKFLARYPSECEAIGGIDPDAAEAAGLAHDLGHPPFGHIAEEELDRLVRRAGVKDGFEGNAQSFRIVCRLAVGDAWTHAGDVASPVSGLNLTRSTLAGIIKYPWAHAQNAKKPAKWGYYAGEREEFEWAHNGHAPLQRSLIAEVMDWADDVTYAIHDLLDFYRAGLIPLELVRKTDSVSGPEREQFLERMFSRRQEWRPRQSEYETALDGILDRFPFDVSHRYSGAELDEQLLYEFATELISRYVNSVTPAKVGSTALVDIQKDARDQVDVLKEFVWRYVILNPDMALLQSGQRRAIRSVFRESLRMARKGATYFFPGIFRQRLIDSSTDYDIVRLAADFVAGMTERELIHAYRRIHGFAT